MKYILVSDCEIVRMSSNLDELVKYKVKHGLNWSDIYRIVKEE